MFSFSVTSKKMKVSLELLKVQANYKINYGSLIKIVIMYIQCKFELAHLPIREKVGF